MKITADMLYNAMDEWYDRNHMTMDDMNDDLEEIALQYAIEKLGITREDACAYLDQKKGGNTAFYYAYVKNRPAHSLTNF